MAKITMTVEADTQDELKVKALAFFGVKEAHPIQPELPLGATPEAATPSPKAPLEGLIKGAKKRTPKAKTEVTGPTATPEEINSDFGTVGTEEEIDLLGNTPAPAAAATATQDDAMDAMKKLMGKIGIPKSREFITTKFGKQKVGELAATQYGSFVKEVNAVLVTYE